MIQLTKQAQSGQVPRLAMINSFAGFGRISDFRLVQSPGISGMLQTGLYPLYGGLSAGMGSTGAEF